MLCNPAHTASRLKHIQEHTAAVGNYCTGTKCMAQAQRLPLSGQHKGNRYPMLTLQCLTTLVLATSTTLFCNTSHPSIRQARASASKSATPPAASLQMIKPLTTSSWLKASLAQRLCIHRARKAVADNPCGALCKPRSHCTQKCCAQTQHRVSHLRPTGAPRLHTRHTFC